jgi:hypothetical protein
LFKVSFDKFYFLVIDKGSLDVGIVECSEEFYLSGKQKTYEAIATYRQFFIDGADIDSYTLRTKL